MKRMLMLAVLVAAMFVGAGMTPALADGGPDYDPEVVARIVDGLSHADDPDAAFVRLPADLQAAVVDFLTLDGVRVEEITPEPGAIEAMSEWLDEGDSGSGSCRTAWARLVGENLLGYDLWWYTVVIDRCFNGSVITDIRSSYEYGTVRYPNWHYRGVIGGPSITGGVGQTYYQRFSQGKMEYCIFNYGCIQSYDPWVALRVYGNGSAQANGG